MKDVCPYKHKMTPSLKQTNRDKMTNCWTDKVVVTLGDVRSNWCVTAGVGEQLLDVIIDSELCDQCDCILLIYSEPSGQLYINHEGSIANV